jgi:WD40 repeat protein
MKNNTNNPTWTYCPNTKLQINSVSISDNGSICAFGTSNEQGDGKFDTYIYNGAGTQLWKKPISSAALATQGVFWVSVSGDGSYVATGGETSTTTKPYGFLQVYKVDTGLQVLNETPTYRVNQVSLSLDGQYLAACYGYSLDVYKYNATTSKYDRIFTTTSPTYEVKSCMISHDGSTVVASGEHYDGSTTPATFTGTVFSYSIATTDVVTLLGTCAIPTACMRVAITDSGQYWAASLHDGSCVLINRNKPGSMEWSCKPDNPNLELAYAVDITQTDDGDVYVACGANLDTQTGDGGFLYLVKSVRMVYDENNLKYPAPYFKGIVQWTNETKYGVNPGVTLDKNATYVTATDGKPLHGSVETPGSFYLSCAATGDLVWKYDTSKRNWPMMIARDGKSAFGGSDEGSVYYWDLSS